MLVPLLAAAAPATAAAQVPTAGTLAGEIAALADAAARQWPPQLDANGQFGNPFPADLARGHGAFVPPMLVYAIQRTGERAGDPALLRVADRAWPEIIDPARASAFDMIGAAYAYRGLTLSAGRRAQLAGYLGRYGIPTNGRRCLLRPRCYSNLKLVDALAVLAITGAGVTSPDPAARLGNPAAARAAAAAVVNQRIPQVVDHAVRALIDGGPIGGTVLSDPPEDPLAYHALSTFMLGEAVAQLGPAASPAVLRARREALDALSVLVAPDGDASYLGARPGAGLGAGAHRGGARRRRARRGRAAPQAGRALPRRGASGRSSGSRALHPGPQGLQLVPGAALRATADGHRRLRAHDRLQRPGAVRAQRGARRARPDRRRPARRAGGRRAAERAGRARHRPRRAGERPRLARRPQDGDEPGRPAPGLRLARAQAPHRRSGWVDLLAPRPLTQVTPDSGGPRSCTSAGRSGRRASACTCAAGGSA